MRVTTLATLLVQHTKAEIYKYALGIATSIGLPVSSWQAGDPTRAAFFVEAEFLESLEAQRVGFTGSGFLDFAVGIWRPVIAKQGFNVDIPEARAATTTVTLTNTKGGVYDIDPGDLTLKNTTTGKTYHSTTGGHLPAKVGAVNGTLDIVVVADEPGSDSSAGAGEIDALVTTLGTVTCSNALAAIGVDEQDWTITKQQCQDKLGSFSPNGPREAYRYVARNPDLTGTNAITDARVYGDSDVGEVTVYLRGPSGAVAESDRALVETAILKYATPLCVTPTVLSCTNVVVPITYSLNLYKSANKTATDAAADILTALEALFAGRPIGGDIVAPATTGKLYRSLIESTILRVFPQAFNVVVALPAGDTTILNNEVAALGTVTPTVTLVVDP